MTMTGKQLAGITQAEIRRTIRRAAKYAEQGHRTAATAELHDLKRHLIGVLGDLINWVGKLYEWILNIDENWRKVWNGIRDFFIGIGEAIGGVFSGIGDWITKAVGWITELPGKIVDALSSLASTVGGIFEDAFNSAYTWVQDKLNAAIDFIKGLPESIKTAAVDLGSSLIDGITEGAGNIAETVGGWINDVITKIGDLAGDLASAALDLGEDFVGGFVDGVESIAEGAADAAKAFANAIIRFFNSNVIDRINDFLEFDVPVPFAPDIHVDPPDLGHIPTFHTGGVVAGFPGQDVLALLQAGEVVRTVRQEQALQDRLAAADNRSYSGDTTLLRVDHMEINKEADAETLLAPLQLAYTLGEI
jgi:hypothetical protein